MGGVAVLTTEDDWSLWQSMAALPPVQVALATVLAGAPPLLLLGRRRLPVPVGMLAGLIIGLLATLLFFFFWPSQWQGGRWNAWKSATIVLGVYWRWLMPIALAAGAGLALLSRRAPRGPKGWRALADPTPPPE